MLRASVNMKFIFENIKMYGKFFSKTPRVGKFLLWRIVGKQNFCLVNSFNIS